MQTIVASNIVALLDAQTGNTIDMPSFAAMLGVTVSDAQAELAPLIAQGQVSYDEVAGTVTLKKVEGEYAPKEDPGIDPAVTQAIADLFADQGVSLSTFLNGLGASGLSGADARVGVYVARELALAIAAKRGDDRLRAPLVNAAKLLDALHGAFTATGQ
jgi:hypothetical protein